MKNKIRTGLISFSFGHQTDYANCLANNKNVELAAVVEVADADKFARERGIEFAKNHNLGYYENVDEFFEKEKLDAVSIAVQPEISSGIIKKAAGKGINIMAEKPLSSTLEKAYEISTFIANAKVKFAIGYPASLFTQQFLNTLESVRKNTIGSPRIINYTYLQPKGEVFAISYEDATPEYKIKKGGGELANFGGYGIIPLAKIANSKLSSVYAEMDSFFFDSYKKIDMEDFAMVTVKFENGTLGHLVIGRTKVNSMPYTDLRMEVIGSEGVIDVNNGMNNRILIYEDYKGTNKTWNRGGYNWEFYGPSPTQLYVDDFINAIIEDRNPEIGMNEAVLSMEFLQAAYKSAKEHKEIILN